MRYEQAWMHRMYEKLMSHANCVTYLDVNFDHIAPEMKAFTSTTEYEIPSVGITNYHDGENVAVECSKCNEVIIDFDRPN